MTEPLFTVVGETTTGTARVLAAFPSGTALARLAHRAADGRIVTHDVVPSDVGSAALASFSLRDLAAGQAVRYAVIGGDPSALRRPRPCLAGRRGIGDAGERQRELEVTPDITPAEAAHVRAAIRFLRIRCGGLKSLAAALGIGRHTLKVVGRRGGVSANTAFRVARFAGVAVDDVLAGRFPAPGACPYCGRGLGQDAGDRVADPRAT